MEPFAPWRRFYGEVKESLEYPETTLWEAVCRVACKYPEYTALIYMNRKITYKEMTERITDVQYGFEKLGVKKGDRVIVALPNIPQAVYILYALNRIGAVACFVHPLSTLRELEECVKITVSDFLVVLSAVKGSFEKSELLKNKRIIITSPADELDGMKRFACECFSRKRRYKNIGYFSWRELTKSRGDLACVSSKLSAYEPAVVLFSGGTTGKQKAVLLSSFALGAMALGTKEMSGSNPTGKAMLAVTPVFHGFGLGVCVHTTLVCAGCCILVPRFSQEECSKIIKKYRPSFIAGVPAMFDALTKSKSLKKADLSFLEGVFSGGDALKEKLKSKLDGYLKERGAKVKVREGYGLTECIAVSCLTPQNKEKNGSVGIPLPDMYYKICKENTTQALPFGEIGEICITGPTLMIGYFCDEEETKKVMKLHSDGRVWLHTGDAGMMDEDGFVYFKGRIKRMIVTNGYNVYPLSVEQVLSQHPAVKACCVIGVKDSCKSQRIKACVVLRKGFCECERLKSELVMHCEKLLIRFAVPAEIEFLQHLPMTRLGKVDYLSLEREENKRFGT